MATIRKLKSGNFQVIIKQSGLKIITKTFPTKRLAVQFQREAEGNTKLLNALGKPIPNLITFSEIVEQYLKADEVKEQPDQTNPLRKPKTVYKSKDPSREGRLKYWCDLFGSKPILTITDDLIDDGLLELAETRTGATVNRYKSNLSAIFIYFNEHKKYKKLKHPNPVKGEFVSNFSASQEKERFLTDDEQIALLNACKDSTWDRLYLLVLMALTTGGRKSELLGLNGLSINFTSRRASLKTTKNGKPRLLPLTQPVIEELIRIRDSSTIVDKNVVSLMPVNNDELIFHGMKHKNKPFEMRKPFARA